MYKVLLVGLLAFATQIAQADVFSFTGINANEVDVTNQLSLDVSQTGNTVDFKFTNALGGNEAFIGHFYFDFIGANLFTSLTQTGQSGIVSFAGDPDSSQNFPEGNNLIPPFTTDADAKRNQGASNGVQLGEYVIFQAMLSSADDINALLNTGDLRIGLHMQGYDSGGSDSYVTVPNPPVSAVPVPAALPLMASALGLFGIARRKK